MARILAYTTPARGHLFPLVPTLEALLARGHDVAVRTLGSQVGMVAAMGLDAAPIDPAIEAIDHDDYGARGSRAKLKRAMSVFAGRAPLEVPDLRRAIEETDPEVLIVDTNAWGAAAVADASGLPWASFVPYPVWLPAPGVPPFGPGLAPARGPLTRLRDRVLGPLILSTTVREVLPRVNAVRSAAGAAALRNGPDLFLTPPLTLYFTAEPFEYHRAAWPDSFRLVGPCAWDPPADPPPWLAEDDRPVVLVSTSSEYQADEALVRCALEALADCEDLQVVATLPAADAEGITVPSNARLEGFAPHGPLLERAVVTICHGGMGITQKSLAAGVPVCVVPFGRDQLEVARRAEHCGAGTRLPATRLTPRRLRAAVDEAIGRADAAASVAKAFAAAGGGPAAAEAVEELIGSAAAPDVPRTG